MDVSARRAMTVALGEVLAWGLVRHVCMSEPYACGDERESQGLYGNLWKSFASPESRLAGRFVGTSLACCAPTI